MARINLIQFYEKDGELYVMNGGSLAQTAADYADNRTRDFLTDFCPSAKLIEPVREHHGGSDWGNACKVLDKNRLIAEAKSRGIGVAFDEEDMKRRNSI